MLNLVEDNMKVPVAKKKHFDDASCLALTLWYDILKGHHHYFKIILFLHMQLQRRYEMALAFGESVIFKGKSGSIRSIVEARKPRR
jgi:hypothetical protein